MDISNISLHQLITIITQVRCDIPSFQQRIVKVVEVIQTYNPLTAIQQAINEVRSNETCATCNQNHTAPYSSNFLHIQTPAPPAPMDYPIQLPRRLMLPPQTRPLPLIQRLHLPIPLIRRPVRLCHYPFHFPPKNSPPTPFVSKHHVFLIQLLAVASMDTCPYPTLSPGCPRGGAGGATTSSAHQAATTRRQLYH